MSTFTPLADDALAVAVELPTEYALVKSSGYLVHVLNLASALHYVKYNGPRVIVSRILGTTEWSVVDQNSDLPETVEISDTLPDDFA